MLVSEFNNLFYLFGGTKIMKNLFTLKDSVVKKSQDNSF